MTLSGKSRLYAILAHPVAHVRASEFFEPVFARHGLDSHLIPLHVLPEDLGEVVAQLERIQNLKGLVITIPHKETIAAMCDQLGEHGRAVGAVNTVRFEPGDGRDRRMVGEMFDGVGLIRAMAAHDIRVGGKRVLLVGTGGAGRAIGFSFAGEGPALLRLANRTVARAEQLAADLRAGGASCAIEVGDPDPTGFDVVVNATSLGLHDGDPMPTDPSRLTPAIAAVEIIAARDTPWLEAARARGCRSMGGRPMVEHQIEAQLQFLGEPIG